MNDSSLDDTNPNTNPHLEVNSEHIDTQYEKLRGGKKSRKRRNKLSRGKKKVKKTKRKRKQKGGMGHEVENYDGLNSEMPHEGGKKRKKTKGTKKKGKASKWIDHVKKFAKLHKIKFPDALKHPACKKSYKKI